MGTNFKKGLSIYGVPILPDASGDVTTGNIFFVDSGNANAADDVGTNGKTSDEPFATVDYAIGQCTANNGDVIYVMPGHAENFTSTGSFNPDVAGVSIIGLGRGSDRPTFTGTTTSSKIVVTGQNVRISNCIFKAGTTGSAVSPTLGMRLYNADQQIDNCTFTNSGSSSYFVTMLQTSSTAQRTNNNKVIFNEFLSITGNTSGTTQAILLSNSSGIDSVGHNMEISGNKFNGTFTQACIESGSSGTVHLGLILKGNDFNNLKAAAGTCVSIRNAITGLAANNNMVCVGSSNVNDVFDPGSMLCVDNYGSDAINVYGIASPPVPAT
jgi:hypothetical protein